MTARASPSHMQPHQPRERTVVAFMYHGEQWGEKGDFVGSPEVAVGKAEKLVRALVASGAWPTGLWRLVPDHGEAKEVRVR